MDGSSLADEEATGNTSRPSSSLGLPLTEGAYIAIGVYVTLLGAGAFIGNVSVLVVILSQKAALRKLQNLLLLNLATADLLVTVTAYPLTSVSSFHKHWLFGDVGCKVSGFLVFCLTMVSLNTLTAIAVFRFILVCKPMYHHLLRPESAKPALLASWLQAAVWTSLPLFGWSQYVPEPFLTSCTVDWGGRSASNLSYVAMTIILCFVVHLVIISFCYVRILVISRRLTFGVRKNSNMIRLEEVLWHHKVETERNVTRMCMVMMATFLLCWTPYALLSCLAIAGLPLSAAMSTLPTMFAKVSCVVNPVIYAFMSSSFRKICWKLFPRGQRNQNRVATAGIELPGKSQTQPQQRAPVREYCGDMTRAGVYIGNMVISLEVQSTVF
ncbi:rhodopsin, G0-coupled-like [Pomacea canaliculata]|uniref:rhodopsin, G0-coupled-like n=1 Tax=Pomacea canaliculata TaxID=400727 RepID=UPI000D7322D9|nr:rhodopsin, G0-coupled-like [Pomacea canaliculata]